MQADYHVVVFEAVVIDGRMTTSTRINSYSTYHTELVDVIAVAEKTYPGAVIYIFDQAYSLIESRNAPSA